MTIQALKGGASPDEAASIGRIVAVSGAQAILQLDVEPQGSALAVTQRPQMGSLLKIDTPRSVVLGLVSGLTVPVPKHGEMEREVWIAELELLGELIKNARGEPETFRRGLSNYPSLGDPVQIASRAELEYTYLSGSGGNTVTVGTIAQDSTIPAVVRTDELLGKHFAILGTTGTGKSCTVALTLRSILKEHAQAHIVLLDPHNEYAACFGKMAEVISPNNLSLPFWFLTFEEFIEALLGNPEGKETEIEILAELVPLAKAAYASGRGTNAQPPAMRRSSMDQTAYSVDTPVPYRISDLVGLIDERMGRLEMKKALAPYRQLKQRLETISSDQRYAFMFGSLTVQDHMVAVLSRIFRIPVDDKPITILELTGLPSEVVNVVVSVLCRLTFDLGLWSEGMVPIMLVCEEAHKYIPNDATLGFEPTRRAISRIAKEGRKYGVSLCIVSQRPAELDSTILSQCNTVFAMRMSNDRDQQIVRAAIPDAASGLLDFLPSLGTKEAIAFGDGVVLPVRIRFDDLPPEAMPRGRTAQFTRRWRETIGDEDFLRSIVRRWRAADAPAHMARPSYTEGPEEPPIGQFDSYGDEPAPYRPERGTESFTRRGPAPRDMARDPEPVRYGNADPAPRARGYADEPAPRARYEEPGPASPRPARPPQQADYDPRRGYDRAPDRAPDRGSERAPDRGPERGYEPQRPTAPQRPVARSEPAPQYQEPQPVRSGGNAGREGLDEMRERLQKSKKGWF